VPSATESRPPRTWTYPALLLTLALLGGVALALPACTIRDARDVMHFGPRHYWECGFDALSVACGSGLLVRDVGIYTPIGRWVLVIVTMLGTSLHLWMLARLLAGRGGGEWVAAQALIAGVLTAVFALATRATCENASTEEAAWLVLAAVYSLGCIAQPVEPGTALMLATAVLCAGLAWTIWMACRFRSALGGGRRIALAAGVWITCCAAAAGSLAWLESPRGTGPRSEPAPLAFQTAGLHTICAASGMPTLQMTDRSPRDGGKAVLAAVQMLGLPLPGVAGGLSGLVVLSALLSRRREGDGWALAGRMVIAVGGLVAIGALGMLAIENGVAGRFQAAPTFADALVDAGSAVCGGGLTSGLTATITSRNLVSGLHVGVNHYQLGMLWIAVITLAGRWLPLWLLARK
jgi:hypothetical protein